VTLKPDLLAGFLALVWLVVFTMAVKVVVAYLAGTLP
jgi:hypothetical protein